MNIAQHIQLRWQRSSYWQRCLIAPALLALLLGASWCADWLGNPNKPWLDEPGEGPVATQALHVLAGVPQALAQYRQQHGRYPATLAQLVPGSLARLPQMPAGVGLRYTSAADGQQFNLAFDYSGPGLNDCSYTLHSSWQCSRDW
ncbi:hypothetical protein SAMN02745857_00838 [Andreprevotia lacus DSM 23236]|uniref:Uncharacterized protein n=1 Tax=Andreprevotia lacus DSM 23236 TaxID=1121001 RepID=A0A1W1X869_9NEIS|nr:hypothetical protein [Andreprevotia lacus]SMC20162.1 hypothetical protein SAMN02745857_00838 [Andreprevotia lacus DSM 23236]